MQLEIIWQLISALNDFCNYFSWPFGSNNFLLKIDDCNHAYDKLSFSVLYFGYFYLALCFYECMCPLFLIVYLTDLELLHYVWDKRPEKEVMNLLPNFLITSKSTSFLLYQFFLLDFYVWRTLIACWRSGSRHCSSAMVFNFRLEYKGTECFLSGPRKKQKSKQTKRLHHLTPKTCFNQKALQRKCVELE